MSVAAIPQWLIGSKNGKRTRIVGGIVVVLLGAALYLTFGTGSSASGPALASQVYDVVPMDLEIKITKDGEIQAINNIDINCQVEGTSTITTIVKEGASVKKGDTILSLDSTEIRQKMEDNSLLLQKAQADLSNASEMLEIQKSSNDTNLESAQVSMTIARLDLKQYEEGTYPQQLANAQTEVEMARITLTNSLEDLGQTKQLYAKNFVTAADVKKSELNVTTSRNAVAKAETALTVLSEYSRAMDLTSKKNSVLQTEQRLNRTRRENASNLSWRTADLTSKEQNLTVLKRRNDRLTEQYAACTVKATSDGMVVYGTSNDRNAQNPIQEGAQVRERQLLVRLPDTSAMKAVVRIHESMVSKLKENQAALVTIVGQAERVPAKIIKISVLADNSQRWWNPDLREYPVDLALDVTPANLKPGIGATVEISLERLSNVLALPLDAVYAAGGERYVFVKDNENVRPVSVTVGQNNETHVEVLEGIKAGQQVLRLQAGQGRELLEAAGIKMNPASRPSTGKPRPTEVSHAG